MKTMLSFKRVQRKIVKWYHSYQADKTLRLNNQVNKFYYSKERGHQSYLIMFGMLPNKLTRVKPQLLRAYWRDYTASQYELQVLGSCLHDLTQRIQRMSGILGERGSFVHVALKLDASTVNLMDYLRQSDGKYTPAVDNIEAFLIALEDFLDSFNRFVSQKGKELEYVVRQLSAIAYASNYLLDDLIALQCDLLQSS